MKRLVSAIVEFLKRNKFLIFGMIIGITVFYGICALSMWIADNPGELNALVRSL
jgi:hypothetical protein